ncbi:TM0106 family RecB-like putative nuclease [Naumannella huperziae]
MSAGFLLDSYAARSCAVKTHNRFDATVPPQPAGDESLPEVFAGGAEHARQMLDALADAVPATIDLRGIDSPTERTARTADAIALGLSLIIAGSPPVDGLGRRTGRPAALLRGPNRADGTAGYFPVLTRFGKLTERRRQSRPSEAAEGAVIRIAALTRPEFSASRGDPERSWRTRNEGLLLQAAHHWRMLQAAGWAAGGPPRAALIGTDRRVTWIDLGQAFLRTYSASSPTGWRLRSPLERYDHEFRFRVKVAKVALRRTGGPQDPAPLVRPIRIRECDHCVWWENCRGQLDDDDLSLRIDKSPLDIREISALRGLGVETVHDLVGADLDRLKIDYLPLVRHRPGAERRLELAARRADLLARDVALERLTSGPIEVPAADVEIDLDIETSRSERVYLWGFRVHDVAAGSPPEFVEFSAWWELDARGERALAVRAIRWLRQLVASGRTVRVYHYSDYEVVQLRRLAAAGDPELAWALEFAREGFCDLYRVVADHYFGAHGLGLKTVATRGAGFTWRDEDPGGLNSLTWFDEAVHAVDPAERAAARARVLAYNEDDVTATWQLRRWLREQQ